MEQEEKWELLRLISEREVERLSKLIEDVSDEAKPIYEGMLAEAQYYKLLIEELTKGI